MLATNLSLQTIAPDNLTYPTELNTCSAFKTAPTLNAIGNLELLSQDAIALFCSIKCPDDLILKTYNLAQALRDAKIPVISGFHTPIEQDCLKILLHGTQSIIYCPARSIHTMRLSPEQQQAITENRLLFISPFKASYSRVTAELAEKRNEMIGAIAHTIFVAYAAPNSRTLTFAQRLIEAKKFVVTMHNPSPAALHKYGIAELDIDEIVKHCLRPKTLEPYQEPTKGCQS